MFGRANSMLASKWLKIGAVGLGLGGTVGVTALLDSDCSHPPKYPWEHRARFTSYDYGSVRRGYQVYKEVCAACHSMERLCYRHLVGITHTQQQAKAEAAEAMIYDLDEFGNQIQRPGKLTDSFPSPYPNENAARAANNQALPPDLSLMAKARDGGADYIFALLCGYGREIPEGVELSNGLHWNPWFPGGGIAMPQPIYDEHVTYPDGTPASIPQMAKDLCEFLTWSGEPHADEKKMWAISIFTSLFIMGVCGVYHKRYLFNVHKTQKITYLGPGKFPS